VSIFVYPFKKGWAKSTHTGLALHALLLEVDMLFRDAEEPIVFLVPMPTEILA
jgi:hypothetical protein